MQTVINGTPIIVVIMYHLVVTGFLITFFLPSLKNNPKSFFDKVILFLCSFSFIFITVWLISDIFLLKTLQNVVRSISYVILPIAWFLAFTGVIIYGSVALITGKTLAKIQGITRKSKGLDARYFGFLWIISGLAMVILEMYVIGLASCQNNQIFCSLATWGDKILETLGTIIILLSTPLRWLGIIKI